MNKYKYTKAQCYKIMGLPLTATPEEIKNKYKKLAFMTHPDRNGGDSKLFLKLQEAHNGITLGQCVRELSAQELDRRKALEDLREAMQHAEMARRKFLEEIQKTLNDLERRYPPKKKAKRHGW